MKAEDQVCSLELAKRLKELGVKQESLYCYVLSEYMILDGNISKNNIILTYKEATKSPNSWSAFTTAELGEMLPAIIEIKSESKYACTDEDSYTDLSICKKNDLLWEVSHFPYFVVDDKKEADARAKMLIHLLKNDIQ